jgi:hypothetical protein
MATADNPRHDHPADWRVAAHNPAASPAQKEAERRQLLLIVSVCILFVLGTVAGILYIMRPVAPPRLISLSVSEYVSEWPLNPFAQYDAAHLEEGFPRTVDPTAVAKPREKEKDFNNQATREQMKKTLAEWLEKSDATAIIHVSALAVVRDSVVYLVPAESRPNPQEPLKDWFALSELIDLIKDGRGRQKLLFLDLAHSQTAPLKHELIQDAAYATNQYLEKLTNDHELPFNVLVSCSAGEVSYPLYETETSVFMHYIVKGLQGGANGYLSADEWDTAITVQELAAYITDHVYLWVNANLDSRQTPRLYGKAPDFYVAPSSREARTSDKDVDEEAPKGPAYPASLLAGWQKRDEWLNAGAGNIAPLLVNQLEGALMRAESFWMYRDVAGANKLLDIASFEQAYKRVPDYMWGLPAMKRLPVTLTEAITSADKANENTASTQWQELRRLEREAAQKPEDKALKSKADERWNMIKSGAKTKKNHEMYAQFFWQTLVSDRDCYDRFDKISELFGTELRNMEAKAEQLGWLLNMIDRVKFKIHRDENSREVGFWLCSRHEQMVRTISLLEPMSLPWVKPKLDALLKEHRQLEAEVYSASSATANYTKLRERFNQLEKGYQEVELQIKRINFSTLQLNRALLYLNGSVEHFWEGLDTQSGMQNTWVELLNKSKSLFDRLSTPRPQTGEDIDLDTRDVATTLEELRRNFRSEEVKKALVAAEQDKVWPPKEHRNLDWLLLGPWLSAEDRKLVWETKRKLALGYHQRRIAEDLKQQNNKPRLSKLKPNEPRDPLAVEFASTDLRYRMAAGLLTIAGVEEAPKLESARPTTNDLNAWKTLGVQMRYAPEYLPALVEAPVKFTNLGRETDADLALRLIPYSIRVEARNQLLSQFYLSPLYRSRTVELARWLHDHYYVPTREHLQATNVAKSFYDSRAIELKNILERMQTEVR